MNDIIDEFEELEEPLSFTFEEIVTEIWTNSREVFRFIHAKRYEHYMLPLLIGAGISKAFDRASTNGMGDTLPLLGVIGACIISGFVFGWLTAYIYAALISWTGGWLDGEGDTRSFIRVIAYASIPSIIGLAFLIPQMVVYGEEMFKDEGDVWSGGMASNIIYWGAVVLEVLLGIYSIVLHVIGVSEVQGFGIGKAILNLILPVLIFLIPILLIVLLVM